MNVYLISQTCNTGYDTFDSAVVVAESAMQAKLFDPSDIWVKQKGPLPKDSDRWESLAKWEWAHWKDVKAEKISAYTGPRVKPFIVCASFNAG